MDSYIKCSICLESFTDINNSPRIKLPCTHEFHKDCLDGWFRRHGSCPNCRMEVFETLPEDNDSSDESTIRYAFASDIQEESQNPLIGIPVPTLICELTAEIAGDVVDQSWHFDAEAVGECSSSPALSSSSSTSLISIEMTSDRFHYINEISTHFISNCIDTNDSSSSSEMDTD